MRAVGDECSCFERSGDGRLQGGRAPAPASLAEQPTGTRGEGKAEALTEPEVLGREKKTAGHQREGRRPPQVLGLEMHSGEKASLAAMDTTV